MKGVCMKKKQDLIEEEVDSLFFTDEYWAMLGNIGFSKEFRLAEQLRKQRETIQFLAIQMDKLKAELQVIRNEKTMLKRIS